jgi:acetyl-CoA carboxylase biotin carboxyl carrier protein
MDMEEIKRLVQLMVDNDLSELDITDGDKKISLKRGGPGPVSLIAAPVAAPVAAPAAGAPAAAPAPVPAANLVDIKSPMVGTFYAAPSPDSDPYVTVGSMINEESAVCIVEAMKVMNEIKAECSGAIAEICVRNAQPVEYGQVLFRVRPA